MTAKSLLAMIANFVDAFIWLDRKCAVLGDIFVLFRICKWHKSHPDISRERWYQHEYWFYFLVHFSSIWHSM